MERGSHAVTRGLVGIVAARIAVNGGIRVVYPFLAVIAHGLGLSLEALALFVAVRALAGLAGPLISRIVTPQRRRTLMLASQLLLIAGCLLVMGSHSAPAHVGTALVGVGFVATGLARPLFDLPMQTWVSAHVPAAARGRALGLTELSWALSLGLTVPVTGVLIGHAGWRSPFVLIIALAAAGTVALMLTVPHDRPGQARSGAAPEVVPIRRSSSMPTVPTVAICLAAGLAVAAAESLLVVHGVWLASDFGLSVSQIGASIVVIVIAELAGEGLVIAFADRLGAARTVRGALLVSAAAYGALGLVGHHAGVALVMLGVLFVAFEVTVIASIALMSTTAGADRDAAGVLGSLMAMIACGNAVGAVIGPVLFAVGGIGLSGAVAACAVAAAAAFLWRAGVRPSARVARRPRNVDGVSTAMFGPRGATAACQPVAETAS